MRSTVSRWATCVPTSSPNTAAARPFSGFRPHDAQAVFAARYGDCKDKANLLRALLGRAGISSALAAIFAHTGLPRPFGLPTLSGSFNHAILVVHLPKGDVIADPTARGTSFGELPSSDLDADLLPLTAAGAPIQKTPALDAARASEDLSLNASLDEQSSSNRHGTATFALTAKGTLATQLRGRLLSEQLADAPLRPEQRLGRWLQVPNAEVVHDELETLPSGDVQATGTLHGAEVATRQGKNWIVRPAALFPTWLPTLASGPRETPVLVSGWGMRRIEVTLTLPPGMQPSTLPAPLEIESPLGHYRLSWRLSSGVDNATLSLERSLVLKKMVVAPEDYEALRDFANKALAAEAHAVLVHPAPSVAQSSL